MCIYVMFIRTIYSMLSQYVFIWYERINVRFLYIYVYSMHIERFMKVLKKL